MTALIDAFQEIDGFLARSIKTEIKPTTLLEDIETGSLRAWLGNALESIDDESLKSGDWKKIVGAYLVNAKRIMVEWTHGRTEVTSSEELEECNEAFWRKRQGPACSGSQCTSPFQPQKLRDPLN
jgi:hypothetical protein